ncbi:MAG: OsmC family protein [Candidatus Bipolaricaulota bacterium]
MDIKVTWQDKMLFEGVGPSGHVVAMDAAQNVGGEDREARPFELMLIALGGCTGMDVISILRKMRTPPNSFEVSIHATQAEEHPKAVQRAQLAYKAHGVPEENLRKAVDLSHERYCSVSHSLGAELETSVEALP